jgi:hypothetical protein
MRGTVVHCSRFGAVIRLEDGRLGALPADAPGMASVRKASTAGRRPQFSFVVDDDSGSRVRLALAEVVPEHDQPAAVRASSSLEQKIVDYLRQTADWDPRITTSEGARTGERSRADRLLPFEFRARRQYRDSPARPRRPKER